MQNCLTRKFGSSGRKFFDNKTNIPGPGNYRLPSEFGYYESKKYASDHQENIMSLDGIKADQGKVESAE